MQLFFPILAGATLRDRIVGCLGATLGIAATAAISGFLLGHGILAPLIVAPMGASAVLLFAVPASPLAQPWPIIGGNTLSALVGVTTARLVHDPVLAAGLAVGLAILIMSFTRCLHPPGGAAALTAVVGGPAVVASGFLFPFAPVALNAIVLVALGWGVHRLSRRSYPHVPVPAPVRTQGTSDPPAAMRIGFNAADVDAALSDLGEAFDIDRGDLDGVLRRIEHRALMRGHGEPRCEDIMARDLITIGPEATTDEARALLLQHGVRVLPVSDADRHLLEVVGLREVSGRAGHVGALMRKAVTAAPAAPATSLVEALTDHVAHAVIIVDDSRIVGLVTQTDLLAALARILPGIPSPDVRVP